MKSGAAFWGVQMALYFVLFLSSGRIYTFEEITPNENA